MDIEFWKSVAAIAQGFGTIVIGAGVGYVAWEQWQTAKRKLDLDLFERRLEVFSETRTFIDSIRVNQGTTSAALIQFLNATNPAYFLFGPEIRQFLTDLYERSKDIGLPANQREASSFSDQQRASQWRKVHDLSMEFDRYKLEEKFAPSMNLVSRR